MDDSVRSDWINGTYEEKLAEFAAERELPRARVDQAFREHCETFRSEVVDGTAPETVRRLAFQKLRWHPPEENESPTD